MDENGDYILVNSKFISSDGKIRKKCSTQLLPLFKENIVMVMSDLPNGKALAKCYYIEENDKYTLNQRICSLTVNKGYASKYIYYKINRNNYYLKFDDGVNQTNLKKEDVLNLNIFLPSYELQKKYSDVITKCDNKVIVEESKLSKLQELKKGLMQSMFV